MVSHWWRQYSLLFWVDTIAMDLSAFLPGQDRARQVTIIKLPKLLHLLIPLASCAGSWCAWPTCPT